MSEVLLYWFGVRGKEEITPGVDRCRANFGHTRQSRPDYGLVF